EARKAGWILARPARIASGSSSGSRRAWNGTLVTTGNLPGTTKRPKEPQSFLSVPPHSMQARGVAADASTGWFAPEVQGPFGQDEPYGGAEGRDRGLSTSFRAPRAYLSTVSTGSPRTGCAGGQMDHRLGRPTRRQR